jgi:WD40 repeat protein
MAFSPDGGRLVSGSQDGWARVWDAAVGQELLRLTHHRGGVLGVAFSPDGGRLVSGGRDGTVRVWDAAAGEELLRLAGHGEAAWAVAFSPNGQRLVSGGCVGSVRVSDVATGEELLAVHALPGREHAAVAGGRVTSCSPGAWRWLGWLAPSPMTGAMTRYPAEVFGPLPVRH